VAGVAPLQCGNDVSVGSNREKNELHKTRTTHTPSFGEQPPSPPRSLSCSVAPLARLQCARTLHQCMLVQCPDCERLVQPITRSSGSSLLCASFSSHFHQWRNTRWPSLQHLIATQCCPRCCGAAGVACDTLACLAFALHRLHFMIPATNARNHHDGRVPPYHCVSTLESALTPTHMYTTSMPLPFPVTPLASLERARPWRAACFNDQCQEIDRVRNASTRRRAHHLQSDHQRPRQVYRSFPSSSLLQSNSDMRQTSSQHRSFLLHCITYVLWRGNLCRVRQTRVPLAWPAFRAPPTHARNHHDGLVTLVHHHCVATLEKRLDAHAHHCVDTTSNPIPSFLHPSLACLRSSGPCRVRSPLA